jgi:hypothetical protein
VGSRPFSVHFRHLYGMVGTINNHVGANDEQIIYICTYIRCFVLMPNYKLYVECHNVEKNAHNVDLTYLHTHVCTYLLSVWSLFFLRTLPQRKRVVGIVFLVGKSSIQFWGLQSARKKAPKDPCTRNLVLSTTCHGVTKAAPFFIFHGKRNNSLFPNVSFTLQHSSRSRYKWPKTIYKWPKMTTNDLKPSTNDKTSNEMKGAWIETALLQILVLKYTPITRWSRVFKNPYCICTWSLFVRELINELTLCTVRSYSYTYLNNTHAVFKTNSGEREKTWKCQTNPTPTEISILLKIEMQTKKLSRTKKKILGRKYANTPFFIFLHIADKTDGVLSPEEASDKTLHT